jgi:ACS family sodium-dependent inorganic phosphate cotransporter
MYALLALQQLFVYLTRFGYPYLVPFIVQEYGFNAAQRAQLLSIFVPGYVITQIPGGYYAQKFGAKPMLIVNLVGMATIMAVLPSAGALGVTGVSACLFGLGVMSGPFIPASTLMKVNWVPYGPTRAWAMYVISLGSNLAKTVAALTIPFLSAKLGWRKVAYLFSATMAAYAAVWTVVARDKPDDSLAVTNESSSAGEATQVAAEKAPPLMKLLTAPPVISCILTNITRDLIDIHTFTFWGPTYFNVALGVPLADVGKLLVWPSALTFFGKMINAAWESSTKYPQFLGCHATPT